MKAMGEERGRQVRLLRTTEWVLWQSRRGLQWTRSPRPDFSKLRRRVAWIEAASSPSSSSTNDPMSCSNIKRSREQLSLHAVGPTR